MPDDEKTKILSPVFRLKPVNRSNKAIIKHVGNLNEEDKLGDEIVELDKTMHPEADLVGKHAIPIKNIGPFEMVARLYRCNIVGSHIVASRRYPMMFMNVHYNRPMVSGALLQLFFSIDIDRDEKKAVKKNAQYVNLKFSGTWYQHLDCDDELIENYEEFLTDMLETEAANKMYTSEDEDFKKQRDDMTENEMAEWVDKYVHENRKFYDELMQDQVKEYKSIRMTRDYFIELSQSEKFYKFLVLAMKCREIHRRVEAGVDEDIVYVIPEKITKMTDVRNKMIADNELILEDES